LSLALLCCALALSAAPAPKIFLVFPLEAKSAEVQLGWVGRGTALAVGDGLRAAGMAVLSRDDRVRLVEGADLPPGLPLSRASMIRVAQQASADFLVYGSYSGSASDLHISLYVLDMHALKLGGNITANGPLSALPLMENDLSWLVLANNGLAEGRSREEHRQLTRTVPNSAYAHYVAGLSASSEEAAMAELGKAVSIYPKFSAARFELGRRYFELGNCAKTVELILPLAGDEPASAEVRFMLGNCYLLQNQFDKSIEQYDALLAAAQSSEAANNLGVACLRKGDYGPAEEWLRKAGEWAAGDPTVALNTAILRYVTGDVEGALRIADESVQMHPSNGMLLFLRSVLLEKMNRPEEAAASLARSKQLGIDPEKLRAQEPKAWTRVFQTLKHR